MREIIQDVFDTLRALPRGLSQKDFSREWLGQSETYWAYIKSSGAEPSTETLIRLWGRLRFEESICAAQLPLAKTELQRDMLLKWTQLYSELGERVFGALNRHASMGVQSRTVSH